MQQRVAIIGAGPAGCAAAFSLRDSGCRVTLYERGRRGKNKPCGDAFIPSAVENLMRLGFDEREIVDLGGVPFTKYHLGAEDCDGLDMGARGYVIPRSRLDQALRDKIAAVADVLYESEVRGVHTRPYGGWTVQVGRDGHSAEHDAVILAAGATSAVASEYGLCGNSIDVVAITSYVNGPAPEAPTFLFEQRWRPGYAWRFPAGDQGANVGICMLSTEGNRAAPAKMRDFLSQEPAAATCSVRGGIGRLWSGRGTTWHHAAGMVSCGDAAGLVDALTGEGISGALASGLVAGATVHSFLRSGRNERTLQAYSRWLGRYFAAKYQSNPVRERFATLSGLMLA